MDDQPKPMLNTPIETGMTAGEEFAQNILGRMNRAHASFVDKSHTLEEPPEQERERVEKWRHEIIQRFSEFSGLEFDPDGRCATPGARMDARFNRVWAELCGQLTAEQDPQKKEQLWRQAGAILRGEEMQSGKLPKP
jgi:hypothetical protein